MQHTGDRHLNISINHNGDFSGIAYITHHPTGLEPMTWAVDGPSLAAGLIRLVPDPPRGMVAASPPLDVATRAVAHATASRITNKVIAITEQLWIPAPPELGQ